VSARGKDQDDAWQKILSHNPRLEDAAIIYVEASGATDDIDDLIYDDNPRDYYDNNKDAYLYITKPNASFTTPLRKVGASHGSRVNPEQSETLRKKLSRYNTCVIYNWTPAY
jgi:hypothetical protein